MKKLFSILLAVFLITAFAGCSSEPSNKPVSKEFVDTKDGLTKVYIAPTWGQSFEYANQAGQKPWTAVGFIFLLAVPVLFYLGKNNKLTFLGLKQGVAFNIILFVLLAAGISAIYSKPGSIKWNNDKPVEKAYFERVGAKYIWDSLKNNCLIENGPHDCK